MLNESDWTDNKTIKMIAGTGYNRLNRFKLNTLRLFSLLRYRKEVLTMILSITN